MRAIGQESGRPRVERNGQAAQPGQGPWIPSVCGGNGGWRPGSSQLLDARARPVALDDLSIARSTDDMIIRF
jgi:hypothetical protein